MKLDKQIKLQIKNSKERSTDQELDQQIISQTNRLNNQKVDENICNLDVIQMQFRCNLDANLI